MGRVPVQGSDMICPECNSRMAVLQTRTFTDEARGFVYIERRRQCACGHRETTIELPKEKFAELIYQPEEI
jgi:transcriptional regulator NrdR family protein